MLRRLRFLLLAALVSVMLLPLAAAKSASPGYEQWRSLFMTVTYAAIIVATVVFGALIYALIRFRARKGGPKEGPHIHGNTRMEIAWTIAPAAVMGWLLIISFQALLAADQTPEDIDFYIDVSAKQFVFDFTYPDGTTSTNGTLRIEQNRIVVANVTAEDVIHAFSIHDLRVMIDAVPGRTNTVWFQPTEPGEYDIYCRELCGVGHSKMKAKLFVFPEGSETYNVTDPSGANRTEFRHWGWPEVAARPPVGDNVTAPPDAKQVSVKAKSGLKFEPTTIEGTLVPGDKAAILVTNEDPALPHTLHIGERKVDGDLESGALWFTPVLQPGETYTLVVDEFPEDKTYLYWCNVPGHYPSMQGELKVGAGSQLDVPEPLLPGFEVVTLLGALVVAAFVVGRRRA